MSRFRVQVFKRKGEGPWIPVSGRNFHSQEAAKAMADAMHDGWRLALPEPDAKLVAVLYRLYLPRKPASRFLVLSTKRKTWSPVRDANNRLQSPPGIPAVWEPAHAH